MLVGAWSEVEWGHGGRWGGGGVAMLTHGSRPLDIKYKSLGENEAYLFCATI